MIAHNLPKGALTDMSTNEMVQWIAMYQVCRASFMTKEAAIFNANCSIEATRPPPYDNSSKEDRMKWITATELVEHVEGGKVYIDTQDDELMNNEYSEYEYAVVDQAYFYEDEYGNDGVLIESDQGTFFVPLSWLINRVWPEGAAI